MCGSNSSEKGYTTLNQIVESSKTNYTTRTNTYEINYNQIGNTNY